MRQSHFMPKCPDRTVPLVQMSAHWRACTVRHTQANRTIIKNAGKTSRKCNFYQRLCLGLKLSNSRWPALQRGTWCLHPGFLGLLILGSSCIFTWVVISFSRRRTTLARSRECPGRRICQSSPLTIAKLQSIRCQSVALNLFGFDFIWILGLEDAMLGYEWLTNGNGPLGKVDPQKVYIKHFSDELTEISSRLA